MADCNKQFEAYNSTIRLSNSKRESLAGSRKVLREKIKAFTDSNANTKKYVVSFDEQGSFAMDTIINPLDGKYDMDDGVYFAGNEPAQTRPQPSTFHSWIQSAVSTHTAKHSDKNTCMRVIFADGHHIDLPIYYKQGNNVPQLAHKRDGWINSDPLAFLAWFNAKKEKHPQLLRIVRYLKGWADYKKEQMPSGLILTILAANNLAPNDRDDIALRETLKRIKSNLQNNFVCFRPTVPSNEDLFKDYSRDQKGFILKRLEEFTNAAETATLHPNPREACLLWQKHFGDRFICSNI